MRMKNGQIVLAIALTFGSIAQAPAQPAPASAFAKLPPPAGAPGWLASAWHTSLTAPLSVPPDAPPPGLSVLPQWYAAADPTGQIATYQPNGATYTPSNAFFQPLGTNGRTCATCHLPESAMGLGLSAIQQRFNASAGKDPLFAPVDGATCPKNVPASGTRSAPIGPLNGGPAGGPLAAPYQTLLTKGLFRIALPVPTNAQFKISVVSDPYGCNTDPNYNQVANADGTTQQIVSVYRRPLMTANLKFKVNTAANSGLLPAIDLLTGAALPTYTATTPLYGTSGNGSIETGNIENGNIMSDGREPTLASQAVDAVLIHSQALTAPTSTQVAQILAFEGGIYAAQLTDNAAGSLYQNNVTAGPQTLSALPTGTLVSAGTSVMTMFDAWNPSLGAEAAQRASIYRGQAIFNNRALVISNVAGFNNAVGTNSFAGTCSVCHGQVNVGDDPTARSQHDTGIGGDLANFGGPKPATDLPVFRLTCTGGNSTAFNGSVVTTNDPGKALITGLCQDIGRFTVGPLRGLAARAPYFSDGSAPTLIDVVNFYDTRFGIGLSAQDKQDLVNFLNTL